LIQNPKGLNHFLKSQPIAPKSKISQANNGVNGPHGFLPETGPGKTLRACKTGDHHDPEKHALVLDTRVETGFRERSWSNN
jgi:hypothetical protein